VVILVILAKRRGRNGSERERLRAHMENPTVRGNRVDLRSGSGTAYVDDDLLQQLREISNMFYKPKDSSAPPLPPLRRALPPLQRHYYPGGSAFPREKKRAKPKN
jgi:hypothetical protein